MKILLADANHGMMEVWVWKSTWRSTETLASIQREGHCVGRTCPMAIGGDVSRPKFAVSVKRTNVAAKNAPNALCNSESGGAGARRAEHL